MGSIISGMAIKEDNQTMSKRSKKKGHVARHRVTRHDQTKMKADKALKILEMAATVQIRKWQRRFILACLTTIAAITATIIATLTALGAM